MKLAQVSAKVAEAERIATITIFQLDGEPYRAKDGSESTISFVGSESKVYRIARERIQRRALNQRRSKVEPAQIIKNRVDLAIAAIVSWHGWEDENDNELPCSPEHVKELLAVEHILNQVAEGIDAHADFFAAPSAT